MQNYCRTWRAGRCTGESGGVVISGAARADAAGAQHRAPRSVAAAAAAVRAAPRQRPVALRDKW